MSESDNPGPLSASGVPSSFDSSPEFFEESRTQKLWRKLKQEPLIPVGCAATCYALYQATKSIRQGDHHQTNRMFRARIYAQGFTLIALVAGSIFYKDERMKRKAFEGKVEDKKAAEKREKWLKELEARDQEDREWRERIEQAGQGARQMSDEATEAMERGRQTMARTTNEARKVAEQGFAAVKETSDDVKVAVESRFSSKSISEEVLRQGWGPGTWVSRTRDAWRSL